jgi:PAS domain S-box-containing protein
MALTPEPIPSERGATEYASRAYLEAALDCVVIADLSGRVVEFNPAAERTFGYTREEALGRTMAELIVPPSLRERHTRAFARFAETREGTLFGRRLELTGMRADGSEFPVELTLSRVEGEPLLICGALRDISEAKRAREDLRHLADEHAALRRVATLVAEQASPTEVFAAVAEEVRQTLNVPLIEMSRYEPDGTAAVIGAAGEHPFRTGTRWPLDGPTVSTLVLQTGLPAKVDYEDLPGTIAEAARQGGLRTGLGVPIVVDGAIWGIIATASTAEQPLPDDTEARLADFTELVAIAISNTQARDELRRLAYEQAALRRVATLIARQATPAEVFSAVAKEVAQVLNVPLTAVVRYGPERVATQVGVWGRENPFPIGTSWTLDDQSVSGLVFRTGRAARVHDYSEVPGPISAALARDAGIHTAVGVPILVDGSPWGVMMALSTEQQELPVDTEARLAAFTELIATAISNTQAREEIRALAHEQGALRRVATLIAELATPAEIFAAVAKEVAEVLGVPVVAINRHESDGDVTVVGTWGDTPFAVGTRWRLDAPTITASVMETGLPARIDDWQGLAGTIAEATRQHGIRSTVGAPIIVDGKVWGAMMVGSSGSEPLPADTESRLLDFTELVATAISNASTHAELIASRARIVSAADEARRQVERDLHDGTQQRLVALGLDVQSVRASIPTEQQDAHAALDQIGRDIEAVLEGVRELSRGLHPALLSQRGLGPSLRALARKSPIQVDLDIELDQRPPESIEIAVYYAVSEALTNAAKHSRASRVSITVATSGAMLRATIEDDGSGGAEASAGSGLVGLIDRVEALGGRFALDSPPGDGTTVTIELPLAGRPAADAASGPERGPGTADASGAPQTELPQVADASTLLAAVAAAPDALYVVDAQGRIRFLNAAALRILGYENERQLLGRPSHDTIHYLRADGTPFPAVECPLLRPRVTGETVRVDEDWFVRQDGSLVPVAYSSAPIPLSDGRGAVVSFRDTSDPPRLEEAPRSAT